MLSIYASEPFTSFHVCIPVSHRSVLLLAQWTIVILSHSLCMLCECMLIQASFLRELGAANVAGPWLITRMGPHMPIQVVFPHELLAAYGADIGAFTAMDAFMVRQVA